MGLWIVALRSTSGDTWMHNVGRPRYILQAINERDAIRQIRTAFPDQLEEGTEWKAWQPAAAKPGIFKL